MSAARISTGSLAREFRKAAAVPSNVAWMLAGMLSSALASLMALTASPRAAPGAKLKETVTAGNCPWWLIARAVEPGSKRVKALRGTCAFGAVLTLVWALLVILAVEPLDACSALLEAT